MLFIICYGLGCYSSKSISQQTDELESSQTFAIPDSLAIDHPCARGFYNSFPLLVYNGKQHSQFEIVEGSTNTSEILSCGLKLAEQGDTLAEKMVLEYFDKKLEPTLVEKNYSSVADLFFQLKGLSSIPSVQAMKVAMKYFSTMTTSTELGYPEDGEYGDYVLGLPVFMDVIIPMMSENDRMKYREIYERMLKEYLASREDEDNLKAFLISFYPIIENAWDRGNIKVASGNPGDNR